MADDMSASFQSTVSDMGNNAATGEPKPANWNTKKFKEEYDLMKLRLSDQKFDIREFPDPLLARPANPPRYYPRGVTQETEERLLQILRAVKAQSK